MKTIITFLILGFNGFLAAGQCCPYINSVTVDPANPIIGDNIRIFTDITTPNQSMFIQHSFTVQNDTIFAEACYWEGMATALQTFYDTIVVGELPAGHYVVQFSANQSATPNGCDVNSSQVYYTEFTVTAVAGLNNPNQAAVNLYPNPVNETLHIEGKDIEAVRLLTIEGKNTNIPSVQGQTTAIDMSRFSAGWYIVEVTVNGQMIREKVLKQ